jgi:aconitase A
MIDAGARILECACGPCIGMGQSPATDAVSVRTFKQELLWAQRDKERQRIPCKP